MQNRKRDADVQNRLLDSVGEGEGGMFRENSIKTCILSMVKQITSPGWMHEVYLLQSLPYYPSCYKALLSRSLIICFISRQARRQYGHISHRSKKESLELKKSQYHQGYYYKSIGKTQRDLVEKEVGGEIRMGNTCKCMADSCQCMTKTTPIL